MAECKARHARYGCKRPKGHKGVHKYWGRCRAAYPGGPRGVYLEWPRE